MVGGWRFSPGLRGAGVSLQGRQPRERHSCSVYGTGRIHCEQSRSVNYRRAINRAETDPRVSREHSSPPLAPVGLDVGNGLLSVGGGCVHGCPLQHVLPTQGPQHFQSAWPILALAHFCLCLSALSNHVQCQYGKSGSPQPRTPPLRLVSGPQRPLATPWPIWLSCCESCSPVGSQIALHCLGPQRSVRPGNPSWASRWGRLAAVEGGWSPSVGPAWAVPWIRKAQLGSQHTLGVRLWLAAQGPGLLLQELREAAPRGQARCFMGTGVLGGLGVGVCGPGPAFGSFRGKDQWSSSHTTCWDVAPWIPELGRWCGNCPVHLCIGPHHIMSSPRCPTTALWGVEISSVIF